jgi:[ribosomal protein S18]-alanine N-acetyltransferase
MIDITLRDYRPGDVPAMFALDLVCFDPVFRFSERAMRRFAEAPGALTALAECDGELAGFAIVQIERHAERVTGYVVTLDVAPAHRGQGLARCLMSEMERKSMAAGAKAMELHVFEQNIPALGLYQALGYGRIAVQADFYGRGLDGAVYRKFIVG